MTTKLAGHLLVECLVAQGVTDVVHVCISSGLSGTFNMVRMITEDYQDKMNIRVVDSRTLSMGLGSMVMAVVESLEAGDDRCERFAAGEDLFASLPTIAPPSSRPE